MSRKKLLIVSPHFSTGGAPQVTLNKVELLNDHFDIMVVEHAFLAWNYAVQRNKIINILGNNFKSLGENKRELLDIIDLFNPDVISMEEFPEMFMDNDLSREVYSDDRTYRIVETTHDSSFPPHEKKWMPDEFVFVSAYNVFKYSHLEIPMRVIEYPVNVHLYLRDNKVKPYLDVCIVGLWTQRKNQGYAIEMARHLVDYNVRFHFLGNQAGNFESYWKPLMENLPDNCIVHGESNDVPKFIKGCDMFLFPSKGDRGNKELNPIAIKEALEYPHIPKMMHNLDVYCNKYNDYRDVVYLSGDSYTDSMNMVKILNLTIESKELIVIGTYPDTKIREDLTVKCIESAKKLGRSIMLVSHYPVELHVQKMVDYYVYDQHNPLTHHSYYNRFTRTSEDYSVEMRIEGLTNQSLTVLTNLINAGKAAKGFGYTKMFYVTFDHVIDEKDYPTIERGFNILNDEWKAVLATLNTPFGKGIQTNGMFFKPEFISRLLDDVRTPEEYNSICEYMWAHNFLEDYMMKKVDKTQGVWVEYPQEETFLVHTGEGKSSNSEYAGIVRCEEDDCNYFYFYTYNETPPFYTLNTYDKEGNSLTLWHTGNREYYLKLDDDVYTAKLELEENNSVREFCVDDPKGIIKILTGSKPVVKRPKIKLVHIQTTLNDEREQLSRASLEQVRDKGWEYILHVNEPYTSLPPIHNCNRPQAVSMELFDEATIAERSTALTPAHYGCYLAFKDAILGEFDDCDHLIVCEGDCLIEGDVGSFVHKVEKCALMLEKSNIGFMSFGDKDTLEFGWPQSPVIREVNEDMYVTDHLIGMQCIMFPKFAKGHLKNKLRTHDWDAADMYFNQIFYGSGYDMGIVYERMTTQADGYSLIDQQFKTFRK
jgi:glycosyltransferase involved in cell wall biosynthesis